MAMFALHHWLGGTIRLFHGRIANIFAYVFVVHGVIAILEIFVEKIFNCT